MEIILHMLLPRLALLLTILVGTALAAPSEGCRRSSLNSEFARLVPGSRTQLFAMHSANLTRTFRLHLPQTYRSHRAAPLIVSFHGNGRNSSYQEQIDQLTLPSMNQDFVVVYPDGAKNINASQSWQGAGYSVPGVNDINFTNELLDHLESELCIDTQRVFATGKSNGAGFVGLMTCNREMSSRFKAFAPVSGAFYPQGVEPCDPSPGVLPIMEFHGMVDPTIPYGGGTGLGGTLPIIWEWVTMKALRNGCTAKPSKITVLKGGNVWKSEWFCDESGRPGFVHFNQSDLAHAWPGTEQVGPELVTATPQIVEFFKTWSVGAEGGGWY